jgi:replicative DNA helicase
MAGDFDRIGDVCSRLYQAPLLLDDTPNIGLAELKSKARQMRRKGARIVFVDYLTLIRHGDSKMPRHERVGEVSKSLKQLAREMDIPIVALSQVGRDAEGKMPTLANLRQSGEIEEDADCIIFMHRDRNVSSGDQTVKIEVAKNRNGVTDNIELIFVPQYTRFEEKVYV